jgi:hypothetical protein
MGLMGPWVISMGPQIQGPIARSICIYCPKNEEYCLDIASFECFRHRFPVTMGLIGSFY